MARISTYSVDTVDANDKLLGTDQSGATRNFQINTTTTTPGGSNSSSLVNYIVEADGRALAFLFHNATYGGESSMQPGTINVTGTATTKAFSAVTTLKVSKFPYAAAIQSSPNTAVNILGEYVGERIKWSDINNPNVYGIYECTAFTQDGSTDFYDMTLAFKSGNGNFMAGNNSSTTPDIYLLELFGTDKNFTYVHQGDASATWNVTHNLNKYPNVVVKVGTAVVQAEVNHINQNSLTISFNGSNSGTAYMN
jgi:hypothetical protein